ncbi:Histone methylation protein DOT1, partial [Phytophthora infestans]
TRSRVGWQTFPTLRIDCCFGWRRRTWRYIAKSAGDRFGKKWHRRRSPNDSFKSIKTLKRTYGKDLDNFSRRFFANDVELPPKFSQQLRSRNGSPDAHAGEVTPDGVTAILSALPPLSRADSFLDTGTGIGDVVAHMALAIQVGISVGIEFQGHLFAYSNNLVFDRSSNDARGVVGGGSSQTLLI